MPLLNPVHHCALRFLTHHCECVHHSRVTFIVYAKVYSLETLLKLVPIYLNSPQQRSRSRYDLCSGSSYHSHITRFWTNLGKPAFLLPLLPGTLQTQIQWFSFILFGAKFPKMNSLIICEHKIFFDITFRYFLFAFKGFVWNKNSYSNYHFVHSN